MLNIVLLVLKIIGITLLVIVGIVLLLLICILFVPVRYTLTGERDTDEGKPLYGSAKAAWLLHIVTGRFEYKDGEQLLTLKIFGIRLKSREEKEKIRSEKERIRNNKKRKKTGTESVEYSMLEYDESTGGINEKKIEAKGRTHVFTVEHEDSSDVSEVSNEEQPFKEKEIEPANVETDIDTEANKNGFRDFIARAAEKYRKLSGGFVSRVRKIINAANKGIDKLTDIKENIDYYYNALSNDKKNREAVELIIKKTKKLLKAIAPRRMKGDIEYGSEDPADTGKFLAGAAMLYPLYGRGITVVPHFDGPVLAFELMFRGRIYIFTLVKIFLQLYFNKKVKRFIHIMKKENTNG